MDIFSVDIVLMNGGSMGGSLKDNSLMDDGSIGNSLMR
jgi:hypothetical protein